MFNRRNKENNKKRNIKIKKLHNPLTLRVNKVGCPTQESL